ncbi:type IV secretory system conjugative DNA transfer family protein [Collinsella tanakaei]|uniref:type IV secretory system conjugative DNA transfer family protein n=1 Tax=Collinsella tanakaei TaxID=626935 RepID=UPI001958D7F6|nr:type IV secretory system conjugative DNA transfer family protein [Collinsella tanakaei]
MAVPAVWRSASWWLADTAWSISAAFEGLGLPAPPNPGPEPAAAFETPWEAVAGAVSEGRAAELATWCVAALVACLVAAAVTHLRWRASLYDGTWVGGSRAPGRPVHGDARLEASPARVRALTRGWEESAAPEGGTVAVGVLGGSVRLLDSVHAVVLAESGEGKSRRVAIPTICANALQGRSLVVNDIKGELYAFTGPWIESLGTHRVVRVSFDAPAASIRFDPLARARAAYASEGAGGATRELRELARCVVPEGTNESQPFFADAARNLLVGLCLFVISSPEVPDGQRTVSTVMGLLAARGGKGPAARVSALAETIPAGDPALEFLASTTEGGGGASVITTLATYLVEYADRNVCRMLRDDEVDLDSVGEVPTAVFVSSSSATGSYARLVQTFVSQSLSALRSCAARNAGRLPVETVLVLDEAASLGRSERLVQDLGEMRSEGLHLLLVCQSLLQLQSVAGYSRDEASTILDLLKDKIVLSCSNADTARMLSAAMGDYTAVAESRSVTRGANSGSTNTGESLIRRPLIAPAELMRWTGRTVGALCIAGSRVIAVPSADVSETFVGRMLGMTSPEAERAMMVSTLADRPDRNGEPPELWQPPEPEPKPKPKKKGAGRAPEKGKDTGQVPTPEDREAPRGRVPEGFKAPRKRPLSAGKTDP